MLSTSGLVKLVFTNLQIDNTREVLLQTGAIESGLRLNLQIVAAAGKCRLGWS